MHIFGKPIPYVTVHCHYFSLNVIFLRLLGPFLPVEVLLKKLSLLKNEYNKELSQSQNADQPNWSRQEGTQNIIGIDCILL